MIGSLRNLHHCALDYLGGCKKLIEPHTNASAVAAALLTSAWRAQFDARPLFSVEDDPICESVHEF
jgi:hypothetical protein